MIKFRMIGAAGLSLVLALALAGPAMAASDGGYGMHRAYHAHDGRAIHRMPAQDFDAYDFGAVRPAYRSGRSGPYGDGNDPGSVDDHMRLPPSANGG
jgi:hypothetical protein